MPGRVFREFAWDGRDASGRVVADGAYRAQITLRDEGRTIMFPDEIRVDATPPEVVDVKVKNAVFSPDGDGRADRASVLYRFSEPAYAVLYVDGHALPHGYRKRPVGSYQWYGKGARPGTHRLALAAQDLAGNLGPSTRELPVRIRYVELGQRRYRVARGTAAARPRLDRRDDAALGARRARRTELGPGARHGRRARLRAARAAGSRAATGSR